MKRVLKICSNSWENASRDKRELTVCRELGMEALVMAKGAPGDSFRQDEVDGFPVYRFSTRPLGTARWLTPLNQVLSLFIWGWKARKFQADIITGHNLPGLFVGYLSNLGNSHKAKLVYDAHEFELGLDNKRNHFQIWGIKHLERFLMNRSAFSIMVNDSIANEVKKIHHPKTPLVVARNVPSYWELNLEEMARIRREFLRELCLPEESFLIMYHGGIVENRGIENMLRAVAMTQGVGAVILGNAQVPSYLNSLRTLCGKLKITNRLLFHPAVPLLELRNYVGAVDVGMSLLQPTIQNHILALPNKFFENIQSLTPVIVSDFPTIGDLVDRYRIGLRVRPESPEEIAAAICRLKNDSEFYSVCKENLKRAKEDSCWEREKLSLTEAYRRIME